MKTKTEVIIQELSTRKNPLPSTYLELKLNISGRHLRTLIAKIRKQNLIKDGFLIYVPEGYKISKDNAEIFRYVQKEWKNAISKLSNLKSAKKYLNRNQISQLKLEL
jgi:hypothetical protein